MARMISSIQTAHDIGLEPFPLPASGDFRIKSWRGATESERARRFHVARSWFIAQGVAIAHHDDDHELREGVLSYTDDGAAGRLTAIKSDGERLPVEIVIEIYGGISFEHKGREYFRPHRRLVWRAGGDHESMPSLFVAFDHYNKTIDAMRPNALFDGTLKDEALEEAWRRQSEIELLTEWADWWARPLPGGAPPNPKEGHTEATDAPRKPSPQVTSKNPSAADSVGRIAYRCASDIQAKPISWLWQGRIARGKVSMLAGNPGLGKSQVTASMAAVVTTGGSWPVDESRCERGNVIFLSAEDDAEDTIRPRLEAAGADLSRVFVLDAVVEAFNADGGEIRRSFNLKTDLTRLGAMLKEIGGAALIVIDPITAYLGEADSHKNAEIRALLSPLSDLAAKHGAAVVCVSHLNKSSGGEPLMRVTGSLAFVAAARAAFIVAKDLEHEGRRLFLPMKNNIGNDQNGLSFTVESAEIRSPASQIVTSRVVWGTEAVTVTADEAMTPQGDTEERSALDDARQFLLGLLADGPVKAGQIKTDSDGAGFNWRTIQRAADRLNIERRKDGMRGGWTWRLPPR